MNKTKRRYKKLTPSQVRHIRALSKNKTRAAIAKTMKISESNVSLIVARKSWTHLR